jgi:hypothetical protein
MLRAVTLVAQWRELQARLPADWADARLLLQADDEARAARAAALLGPAMPGRHGREIRFYATRRGAGIAPAAVERLLARLDEERIAGRLELLAADEPTEQDPETHRPTLAGTWDALLATLPPDWSDLYGEIELESSDWLERAALLLSPLNPARFGGIPGFRFRVSRRFGYGTAPEMALRSFERLDDAGIRGELRIVYVLSDTYPVSTQGPVFRLDGRAV